MQRFHNIKHVMTKVRYDGGLVWQRSPVAGALQWSYKSFWELLAIDPFSCLGMRMCSGFFFFFWIDDPFNWLSKSLSDTCAFGEEFYSSYIMSIATSIIFLWRVHLVALQACLKNEIKRFDLYMLQHQLSFLSSHVSRKWLIKFWSTETVG